MKRRIKNALHIACDDIDLTTVSHIEFYLRQSRFFRQYTPEVISAHEMLVEIPFEDAKQMTATSAELQFAFTDADGNPRATEPETVPVGDLLKEAFITWAGGIYQIDTPSHSFAEIKMAALANKTVRLKLDASKMGISTIEVLSFVALKGGTTIYFGNADGILAGVSGASVTSNDVWSYEHKVFVTEEV